MPDVDPKRPASWQEIRGVVLENTVAQPQWLNSAPTARAFGRFGSPSRQGAPQAASAPTFSRDRSWQPQLGKPWRLSTIASAFGDTRAASHWICAGGFNESAQHHLILLDRGVGNGDVTDMVHGSTEGRAVGALEEWVECCGDLPSPGSEEQDWRSAHRDASRRHRAGAAAKSFGSVKT